MVSSKNKLTRLPLTHNAPAVQKFSYTQLATDDNSADSAKTSAQFHPSRPVQSRLTELADKPRLRRGQDASRQKIAEQKLAHVKEKPVNKLLEKVDSQTPVDRAPRYVAHWKIAIVYDGNGKNEIFHGRTYELSLTGASIYSDHNIFITGSVTVLLALPGYREGKVKEKIVEIKSRMVYTILSADSHQFRIGLQFLSFKKGEEHFIEAALQDRHQITSLY